MTTFDPHESTGVEVGRWLAGALVANETRASRWAFEPLALRMGHRDDVAHDLLGVYQELPDEAKARWREGVVAAVSDATVQANPEVAITVIDFAVLIGASEILAALPSVAVAAKNSRSERLLSRIVDAILELPGEPAIELACLYAVSDGDSLPSTSAGLVLVALCRCAPDRWLEHARRLSPAMETLADGLPPDSTALRHYAASMVSAIGLERMARDWRALVAESTLTWLHAALVDGDQPPLTIKGGKLELGTDAEIQLRPADMSNEAATMAKDLLIGVLVRTPSVDIGPAPMDSVASVASGKEAPHIWVAYGQPSEAEGEFVNVSHLAVRSKYPESHAWRRTKVAEDLGRRHADLRTSPLELFETQAVESGAREWTPDTHELTINDAGSFINWRTKRRLIYAYTPRKAQPQQLVSHCHAAPAKGVYELA